MKWLLAISIGLALTVATPLPSNAEPIASDRITATAVIYEQGNKNSLPLGMNLIQKITLLEKQQARAEELERNTESVLSVVAKLKYQVGKTWYVFSGHSPRGWDCSGLVYWAYTEQLGISVEHSANAQGNSGTKVRTPKVGDVVVFAYKGSKSYYHSSIYVGDGKVIHAGFRKGTSTEIISLDDPSFRNSTATFIRLIDTNL